MLGIKVWRRLLGVCDRTVIERIEFDEDADAVVASVRPRRAKKQRCGRCGRRAPGYDQGEGRRRWRSLDLGEVRSFVEADAPRVNCPEHGPTVIEVPWARHGAGHTRAFDGTVAWLATHTSKTAITELLRIAWATVGAIVARVVDEARAEVDPFDALVRIGIDEISYKRGHRYLTVVVDHDSGRLVWAAKGRDKKTLEGFFDALGGQRCAQVRLVSCDAAEWVGDVVRARCPNATVCLDAFHLVKWVTDALDEVRRDTWNEARRNGMRTHARDLKGARYALWKNPEDLTARQQAKLAWVAKVNQRLYRAYLLKEQFRQIIAVKGVRAILMLEEWLDWAARCRIPAFVELGRRIRKNLAGVEASLLNNLSNALVESTNTKLRVLTRVAYGFKEPEHLIALALLDRGGYCPPLPGRSAA
ncbi:MAG: ISL3 family transposase [Acidimicrobiia bacterium]|nr:ISL3 family transposase [Acidimicrobiia bacterium]